jgi:predicted DNA-binding transcriptional regulator AlpA
MVTKHLRAAVACQAAEAMNDLRSNALGSAAMITVAEFAQLARLSRRQIDRLRRRRLEGFPREYELGSGGSKYRRCPRFRLAEVQRWLDSRALW